MIRTPGTGRGETQGEAESDTQRETLAMFETIASAMNDAIVVLRVAKPQGGRIATEFPSLVWCNEAAAEHLGLSPRDVGRAEWYRAPFSRNGALWSSLLTVLRDGVTVRTEVPFVTLDDHVVQLALTITPLRAVREGANLWTLVAHDLHGCAVPVGAAVPQNTVEQAYRLQTLGLLTGSIAHDFGNLVHVIGGYATLAVGSATLDGAVASMQVVQQAAVRAGALARQLLDFSKQRGATITSVDLRELLQHAAPMLERLAGAGVQVEWSVHDDVLAATVRGNVLQLEQVLINLVINARDAQPGGGRVVIKVTVEAFDTLSPPAPMASRPVHVVRLCVHDEGPGIPAALRTRVLDPFFTTKYHGTGLGLSTVQHIVQQAGGVVRLGAARSGGLAADIVLPRAER